jgi:hypothetical protein
MPRTGKCPNFAGCLLAYRNENITLPDDAPFDCPECGLPLVGGKPPVAIPIIILGGIILLVIMGAIAVYIRVLHLRDDQAAGQIGTSFEQAEVAAEHGEFLPSRHMTVIATPTPNTAGAQASP